MQPNNDTSVKIPAAVQAAAARADQLFQQVYAPNTESKPAEENVSVESAAPETQTESAPAAENPKPAAETPTVSSPPPDEDWEHKYKSLKGRYDSQETRLRDMARMIADLQAELAAKPTTHRSTETSPTEPLLSPEEINDYGSDFLKVVGKKAKEELTPEVKALQGRIEDLQAELGELKGYTKQSARERMVSLMDTDLPDWRVLNENQKFLDWLLLPDLYSGAIRQNLLNAAFERNDGPRVLAFFRGFLSEEAALDPAPTVRQPVAEQPKAPKIPLTSLAAPGRAKTAAATTAPAEKPFFTRADIARFFADVAANKYRGREADKNRIEAQIFEAQREGRVQ